MIDRRGASVRGADWGLKVAAAVGVCLYSLLPSSMSLLHSEVSLIFLCWILGLVIAGMVAAKLWSGEVSYVKGFVGGAVVGLFLIPLFWLTALHHLPLTLEAVKWWVLGTIAIGAVLNPRLRLVMPGWFGRESE